MMKRSLAAIAVWLWATASYAGVSCTLPFNLQNGTTADATQVMANYNALVTCLTNAASVGVNTDITALLGLNTPIPPDGGGTTLFVGGTSTGTGNAQTVGSVTPATFSLTTGYTVSFTVGTSNTDATTLDVNTTGALTLYRRTQLGLQPLVGGELVLGNPVTVRYNGTRWIILGDQVTRVGQMIDWAGSTAPAGTHFADGSCESRTGAGAALFSVIGTTYDPTGTTCDTAHFALPDFRGRVTAYQDNMGGTAANRITNAASSCVGTQLGVGCGIQNRTITQTFLPAVTLTTTIAAGQGSHTHLNPAKQPGGPDISLASGGGSSVGSFATDAATLPAMTGTTPLGGGGATFPLLPPLQIATKVIQY